MALVPLVTRLPYPLESLRLRTNDVLASTILFGGLLFALVVTLVRSPALFQQPVTAGAMALSYTRYGGLFYAVRVGKRWAKKLFVVGVALSVVYSLAYYEDTIQLLHKGWWPAVNYAVTYASRVLAFVILVKSPLPEQAE